MKILIRLFLFLIALNLWAKAPFDGERFENLEPVPDKPFFQLLKWKLSGSAIAWPDWIDSFPSSVLKARSNKNEIHWTFINHASVLLQIDGVNILTDPIWSDRASPVPFLGPKRVRAAGIAFENLPPIDVVMISHNHYDHLDLATLERLKNDFDPIFLVGLKNGALLESVGIKKIVEMDWWQKYQHADLNIIFVPAQHWSARGFFDKRKMLWGGFVIEGSQRVYFAGDTGWGSFFKLIREKIGVPDLAFIPIGAYEPRWFMKGFHINPMEAVKAHQILGAKQSAGIHFGTFQLTDEGVNDPIKDLEAAKVALKVSDFVVPNFGETIILKTGE